MRDIDPRTSVQHIEFAIGTFTILPFARMARELLRCRLENVFGKRRTSDGQWMLASWSASLVSANFALGLPVPVMYPRCAT